MALDNYQKKRDFDKTPEPKGERAQDEGHRFVVHEHHASRLHFDLRLEMNGVLKSWSVPKGPSMNPADKRLAVMVEDHPLDYIAFRGEIAEGNYGAGEVEIWDSGTYEPIENELDKGKLVVELMGAKLKGAFHLVRLKDKAKEWLLIKGRDEFADPNWKLQQILPGGSRKERKEIRSEDVIGAKHLPSDLSMSRAPAANASPLQRPKRSDPMPRTISPMLATLVDKPFTDPRWLFEIKWDGYRGIAFVTPTDFRFVSRNNEDLIARFPQAEAIPGLIDAETAILDGEIVMIDETGKPSFQALQNVARIFPGGPKPDEHKFRLVYYVFDLLYLDGTDLRSKPVIERKELLKTIIRANEFMKYSDHVEGRGEQLYDQASKTGLEGVIGKRMDSPYIEKRTSYWVKVKAVRTQEVVIGGYTHPRRSRPYFGALVVGVYEGDKLQCVGQVGGGFDDATLEQIYNALQPLRTDKCPFAEVPKTNEPAEWVTPELVCEVKFAQWTNEGVMRQPVFLGMRPDKDPREVVRETPKEVQQVVEQPTSHVFRRKVIPAEEAFAQDKLAGNIRVSIDGAEVSLTNLDKVYWPDEGYTKGDLLRYYYRVRETILPYLVGRPLILRRFPNGIREESFYQHNVENAPVYLRTVPLTEGDSVVNYAVVDNTAGLLHVANLGCIAMNPFMSRVESLETPDWLALDLDPEEAPFESVCEVAMAVKSVLDEVGISGYPKTSGSRGMHVFIPVDHLYTFEQAQAFAEILANAVAARLPDKATTERTIRKRTSDQVYVDYLQNAERKTLAGPYSVRECPRATVSTPLTWEEVEAKPDKRRFTILTVPDRVADVGDLFHKVLTDRQRLAEPTRRLEKLRG
jgi:bifunctional non-homologous end joining protein LigD